MGSERVKGCWNMLERRVFSSHSLPDGWLLAKTRALRSGPVNKVYVRLERKLQHFGFNGGRTTQALGPKAHIRGDKRIMAPLLGTRE
jgi:hypothetical protein